MTTQADPPRSGSGSGPVTTDADGPGLGARPILILATGTFVSMATVRVADAMLPELSRVFSASLADVAPVVSAYAITYGLMQLFYGALGDRYGKLLVVTIATFVSCLGNLAAALAGSLDQLVLARVLTGLSAAAIIPLMLAFVGDAVTYVKRQATLARLATGTALGIIFGQLAGGILTDTMGWRSAFALLAGIYFLVGILLVREFRPHLRLIPASERPAGQPGFFARCWAILQRPRARMVLLIAFFDGLLVFGVLAMIPAYLYEEFGMSLSAAGATLAFFGVGGVAYSLIAGRMIVALGEVRLALLGGVLIGGAYLLLGLSPTAILAVPLTLAAGFGFYMLHNTLQTNATQMAPEARGVGVSLFASILFVGQAVGVALAAAMVVGLGARTAFVSGGILLIMLGFAFAMSLRALHRGNAH